MQIWYLFKLILGFTCFLKQLFESSAHMSTSAVCSLLTALRHVSNESLLGVTSGLGQTVSGNMPNMASSVSMPQSMPKVFAIERMVATLLHNLHSKYPYWRCWHPGRREGKKLFLCLSFHASPICLACTRNLGWWECAFQITTSLLVFELLTWYVRELSSHVRKTFQLSPNRIYFPSDPC